LLEELIRSYITSEKNLYNETFEKCWMRALRDSLSISFLGFLICDLNVVLVNFLFYPLKLEIFCQAYSTDYLGSRDVVTSGSRMMWCHGHIREAIAYNTSTKAMALSS
jgi:hypothetical protein